MKKVILGMVIGALAMGAAANAETLQIDGSTTVGLSGFYLTDNLSQRDKWKIPTNTFLPPGGFIPLSRTSPALDLDALIGGFKPLFRALDPEKVNTIATTLITVFQGQGGTINDILDHTAQLTSQLGERDQAIGEVVKNLNIVLDTTVRHRQQFDQTINNLEGLITGLNDHRQQQKVRYIH